MFTMTYMPTRSFLQMKFSIYCIFHKSITKHYGRTDGRTDKRSYRDGWTHLKTTHFRQITTAHQLLFSRRPNVFIHERSCNLVFRSVMNLMIVLWGLRVFPFVCPQVCPSTCPSVRHVWSRVAAPTVRSLVLFCLVNLNLDPFCLFLSINKTDL